MTTEESRRLLDACQKGDASAFRQLVTKHYGYVYRVAFRVLLDREEASDVAQDTFIKVWKTIGTVSPRMEFTTWLYRVVVNTALDALRRRGRRPTVRLHDAVAAHATERPDRDAEMKDVQDLAVSLLHNLPPVQRLVIALRDFEDLPVHDVAVITGSSESSVKANLSYARKRLRELFASTYGITETGL